MCSIQRTSDSDEPSLLCALPRDVALNCLLRVPRIDHLNVSCVSKTLRSHVRSPEFQRLRSLLLKKGSVYVSYIALPDQTYRGFTLCNYRLFLVPVPAPDPVRTFYEKLFHHFPLRHTVAVGPEIYFVGGRYLQLSSELWILDTQSGKLTEGPSFKCARKGGDYAVGVVDGKVYVIGGGKEVQVEVFDPKTRSWSFAGEEKVGCCAFSFTASLEGKVYMFNYLGELISVYDPNPRRDSKKEIMKRLLKKRKRENKVERLLEGVCVVENVLYACFSKSSSKSRLMWFDTKLKVWNKLVRRDGKGKYPFYVYNMAEYNGMLAVFWIKRKVGDPSRKMVKDTMCGLISLDRVGREIGWKMEWSGIVANFPSNYILFNCLAVSN